VLEQWRRSETLLEVNLSTGPTIYGTLLAFDRFMIAVLHQGKLQAIYKHAILALAPIAIAPTDDEVITRPIPYLKRQEGSEPR
jgi:RNA chaperone Hfq